MCDVQSLDEFSFHGHLQLPCPILWEFQNSHPCSRIPTLAPEFLPLLQNSHLCSRIPMLAPEFPSFLQNSHPWSRIPTPVPEFPPLLQNSHPCSRIPTRFSLSAARTCVHKDIFGFCSPPEPPALPWQEVPPVPYPAVGLLDVLHAPAPLLTGEEFVLQRDSRAQPQPQGPSPGLCWWLSPPPVPWHCYCPPCPPLCANSSRFAPCPAEGTWSDPSLSPAPCPCCLSLGTAETQGLSHLTPGMGSWPHQV